MNTCTSVARKLIALLFAMLVAASPQQARADAGIRTDFGDVLIENLGIGKTYNLRDLAGVPLKVTNTGIGTIDLLIDVHAPTPDMIMPTRREKGFKSIPSPYWVTLSKNQFIVPPKESAYTDVLISIPNDPSLYGKKFQVSIYSRTVGKQFLNVGVWSHLLLTIVESPEVQAQIEKNRKHGIVSNMDYSLMPDKIVIEDATPGCKINLTKEKRRSIRIANSGTDPIKLRMTVLPSGETPIGRPEGFEDPHDASWLKTSSDVIEVEPATFGDPGLVLNLPNDPTLKGKNLAFSLKVEPADADKVGVTFYGKVYVEVK
jgi:hypothetical protein